MSVFKKLVCLFKGHDSSYLFNSLIDDRKNVRDYNIYGCARCGAVYATCQKAESPTYERWQELAGVNDAEPRFEKEEVELPVEGHSTAVVDVAIKDFLTNVRVSEVLEKTAKEDEQA